MIYDVVSILQSVEPYEADIEKEKQRIARNQSKVDLAKVCPSSVL